MAFQWAPYLSLENANWPEVGGLVKHNSLKLWYLVGEQSLFSTVMTPCSAN